jgi:kumamolisin
MVHTLHRYARTLAALTALCAALGLTASAAAAAGRLSLVLPLRADAAGLRRFAAAVSTPGSPQYGQYESVRWLARHFGAPVAQARRAEVYLRSVGATDVRLDPTALFIDASLPAATAQRLFRTPLLARVSRAGRYTVPAVTPRVPAALQGVVTGVVGLDTRPLQLGTSYRRATRSVRDAYTSGSAYAPASGSPAGCAQGVGTGGFTPNQYLSAYNFTALHAAGLTGAGEKVALIEIDGYYPQDIRTFARCFGLHLPPIDPYSVSTGGKALPPGGEATLDLEVLDAAAPNLNQIDVYESRPQAAYVLRALTAPLSPGAPTPQVISASLGLCESQTVEAVGRAGIAATEAALQMAAASGISFLAASGDSGSADCVSGNSQGGTPVPQLAVNYPASSPWATGVGGTNLTLNAANGILSQTVWNDGSADPGAAGGGGLSGLFARPSYQTATVSVNQRAVPDVALLADVEPGYAVYCTAQPDCVSAGGSGPWQTVGGTSAATPLLAGGLALIDQDLREHQLQDLGLINPLLYNLGRSPQAAGVFADVTVGSNDVGPFIQASGQPLGCCSAGPGFDAASGWGGVNLGGLAAAALSAQPKLVHITLTLPPRQRPVFYRGVFAKVTCDGACLTGAYATVSIAGSKPFTDYSNLYTLTGAGTRTIKVAFKNAQLSMATQLRRLHAALDAHRRITVAVTGAIVDSARNIERTSRTLRLRVTR